MKGAKPKKAVEKELSKKADETNLKKRKQVVKDKTKKARKPKKERQAKDPNKPKRPPSAFFVFLEEFRKTFKADNPNVKAVSAVGRAGGDKWKSMSDAEKGPYAAKAEKRKAEYEKSIQAYNAKKPAEDDVPEESDKSKSEINDDDEEGSEEEEED